MATINVQYTNSASEQPVARIDFAAFESAGNAEPTSRVLDGSDDHGAAEEWAEPGYVVIDGERRPAAAMYLFDAGEVVAEGADYPWDADHVARIILRD